MLVKRQLPADILAGPELDRTAQLAERRIREIGRVLTERFRRSQIGTIHRALTLDDGTMAVTGNYVKVRIPPGRDRNEWVRVRMTSEHDGELLRG